MGSEDLFHKRKARASTELQRQKRERAQNKRYLIVCEGTKTEPHYLSELLDDLRIRSHMVRIARNDGASPDRVVGHALSLYVEDAATGDAYDTVYCVFDRDRHTTFDAAVQRTKDLNAEGKTFVAITSTPCFEVWLLLHFGYSTQPFHSAGRKSVGDQVVGALKTKPGFANYGKGQSGIYHRLRDRLDDALICAERLRGHCVASASINPATDVDVLVKVIQALAAK
ncbi:MAG: RloB domain-containing protein [Burkholderiaceae bacterium]|nr:RloB domain-containing protein [Xylophilus sp.]MBP6559306.1 RloB domain-containing protein [Burkholderiaceae bacterium]